MTGALDQRTWPGGACGCWAVLVGVATAACSAHDGKPPTPDKNEADVRPGKTIRAPEPGEFAPVWHVGDRWTVRERRAQRADPRIKGRIRDVHRESVWEFRVFAPSAQRRANASLSQSTTTTDWRRRALHTYSSSGGYPCSTMRSSVRGLAGRFSRFQIPTVDRGRSRQSGE